MRLRRQANTSEALPSNDTNRGLIETTDHRYNLMTAVLFMKPDFLCFFPLYRESIRIRRITH